jgi:6-phosphogluconolactonase
VTELTTVAADELAPRAAQLVAALIEGALAERGVAHVALAGGETPRAVYELLAPAGWDGVELWFGDERCVAPDDPDANYRMVVESLRAPGAIIHRIAGELGAERAAAAYDALLRERIPGDPPVLDVALLGIGPDGHTASLFPGNPALDARGVACVGVHNAPKPPPDRVTLTLEVLRAARRCVLLASGESKAEAIRAALAGADPRVPASLLDAANLQLLVDHAAAP